MRIEHLSFSGQGPLSGFEAAFKPVTLIIGDNERGKSLLLSTAAEALFEKTPPHVHAEGSFFTDRGDAYRLKNILYFNGSEISRQGIKNWDEELRGLLFGRDEVSKALRGSFLKTMGVDDSSPWLHNLHKELLNFKGILNEAMSLSALEENKDTDLENKLMQAQITKNSLFPLMVKVRLGREYLSLWESCQNILHKKESISRPDPSEAENLGREIAALEKEAQKKRLRLEAWEQGASLSPWEHFQLFSGNVLSFTLACVFLSSSFMLAWYGRSLPYVHPSKLGALAFFSLSSFLFLKTVFGEIRRSTEDGEGYSEGKARFMEKEHKNLVALEESLYAKRSLYRKKIDSLRRSSYQDESSALRQEYEGLQHLLQEQEEKILPLYRSADPVFIQREIEKGEAELKEADLLEFARQNEAPALISTESPLKFQAFSKALKQLKESIKPALIGGRYPEIASWAEGSSLASLRNIADELEILLEKLAKDRLSAEKLVQSYKELAGSGEELLFRIFHGEDFRRLVQWIFGGKYKTFDIGLDGQGRFQIRARTGADELIPIENLSAAASLQFYFTLKLALAQELLDEEPGIFLMDESLSLFDTLRARQFISLLQIFAKGGWQIIYAMKDDKLIYDEFRAKFDNLEVINLNKAEGLGL